MLIEVPFLSISTISSLDNKVLVVDQIEVSVFFQLRNNVEWSLNKETEVFVKFSLLWFLWIFINIDDVPLLVDLSMFVVDNDVSVLSINST